MEALDHHLSSSTYDRDLDARPMEPRHAIEPLADYQRFLVNPLLAVSVGVAALIWMRFALHGRHLPLFLASLAVLAVPFLTVQYHCLDCGATGWLLGARRHACPPALERWREGRSSGWRLPGIRAQMIIWLHVLAAVAALAVIFLVLGR
jgi:hypothetical protein